MTGCFLTWYMIVLRGAINLSLLYFAQDYITLLFTRFPFTFISEEFIVIVVHSKTCKEGSVHVHVNMFIIINIK